MFLDLNGLIKPINPAHCFYFWFWSINACLQSMTRNTLYGYVSSPPIEIFHTPIFHTPPLDSISRLLSSRAFCSIDSSPWRLSCSCQKTHGCLLGMTASGKIHILSHHAIFMTQQLHKSQLVFFVLQATYNPEIDVCKGQGPERSLVKEGREGSSTVVSNRAALLCCSVLAQWERQRQRGRVRQEVGGGVKRLPEIIQQSDRNTT